jgi:two-component system response regulator
MSAACRRDELELPMIDVFQCSADTSKKSKAGFVRLCGREMLDTPARRVVLMMVDDDEDDCLLVQEAITEACVDCAFHSVQDGTELWDYLNHKGRYAELATAPRPDIILLDLNMPKMDGRQVLELLKSDPRFRGIPVIILTTSRDSEDVKLCYNLGANSYVTKQSSFEGIVSSIKTITEYWLEIATLPSHTTEPLDSGNQRE